MFNISSFLEKFSKHMASSEQALEIISVAIEKETGIMLPIEKIELKNGVVFLSASPAVKNKLFIYKKAILSCIASRGLTASDIR